MPDVRSLKGTDSSGPVTGCAEYFVLVDLSGSSGTFSNLRQAKQVVLIYFLADPAPSKFAFLGAFDLRKFLLR